MLNKFIYLLAVLGLCCCVSGATLWLWCAGFCCTGWAFGCLGFSSCGGLSSCGSQALVAPLQGGIEPMSPSLAGEFLALTHQGKPLYFSVNCLSNT